MKQLNKHRIKTWLWLLLLTVLTGVTLTAARFQADDVIKGVEAEVVLLEEGNNLIQPEEFVSMVAKKFGPMTGLPIDMVDMRSVEAYLLTNPYVREADVYLGAGGKLMMTLHQRMPLMRIVDNSGRHWYIDTDTVMMPVSRFFTARVPLVNGDFPATNNVKQWPVEDLFKLSELLRDDDFMYSLIDQIYMERTDKIWLVPRLGPTRILIGDTQNLESKAERIEKIYKEVLPAKGWDAYSYIDTRFEGQVVAKKKINQ